MMIPTLPEGLKSTLLEIAFLGTNVMVVINPFVYIAFSSELRKKMIKFYIGSISEGSEVPKATKGASFIRRSVKRGNGVHPTPAGSGGMGRTAMGVKERGRSRHREGAFGDASMIELDQTASRK